MLVTRQLSGSGGPPQGATDTVLVVISTPYLRSADSDRIRAAITFATQPVPAGGAMTVATDRQQRLTYRDEVSS